MARSRRATTADIEDIALGLPGAELVPGDGHFFTTDHFNGYNAVLLRLAHLGQLTRAELSEIIVDSWRCRAPVSLRRQWEQQAPR